MVLPFGSFTCHSWQRLLRLDQANHFKVSAMTFKKIASDKRSRAAASPKGGQQRGEACPLTLTGGESLQKSKIDWFTSTFDLGEATIQAVFKFMSNLMGGLIGEERGGMHFFEKGIRLYKVIDGQQIYVADIDHGGENVKGRCRIDIKGRGCGLVTSWKLLHDTLQCFDNVKVTRADIARDFLHGEYTVEQCRDWYLHGDFNNGGRMPSHSTPGDWLTGGERGRTLEVGRRKNGKMLRAYEKGRQLGDPNSKWLRIEVEIRSIDREVPLDVLLHPDTYFAGAYACLESLVDASPTRIETDQKEGEISLEKLVSHMREAYGRAVNVLRFSVDPQEIIDIISRDGVPARLEKAALRGIQNWGSGFHTTQEVKHERL
jgi:phage replication initiation protein